MPVYINELETAVPAHDIHQKFVEYAPRLLSDAKAQAALKRLAARGQIEHRYSVFKPHPAEHFLDEGGFYSFGRKADTQDRMELYARHALPLAKEAIGRLHIGNVTHILVTTCTGFYAPGIDIEILNLFNLDPSVERTIVGFMGCYAAINALKLAYHIVNADTLARVLILNLELCTLHLKLDASIEDLIPFLIFADGCAASLVSSEPHGLHLESFRSSLIPQSMDQIKWSVGNHGFDMVLSSQVPAAIASCLPDKIDSLLDGIQKQDVAHWAIHPGGRGVLDAVRLSLGLEEFSMAYSRNILKNFGNMSSATIMFVLKEIMQSTEAGPGLAIAFGPGIAIESMRFSHAGGAS
ncbi:MAG TPA: type III polyketide synthase [Micavibrio sp.]|nr:type III polyketide synthase [Micavibrio sp.]